MLPAHPAYRGLPTQLCLLGFAAGAASGQVRWLGPGGNPNTPTTGNWNAAANWAGGAAPASAAGTSLLFSQTVGAAYTATNNLANPFDLSALTIHSAANDGSSITGSGLRFLYRPGPLPPAPAALVKNGARDFTINAPLIVPDTLDISANGGILWLRRNGTPAAGHFTLNGNLRIFGKPGGTVNLGSADVGGDSNIDGTGRLLIEGAYSNQTGNGTKIGLYGHSTFSGGTTINSGRVAFGHSSTFLPNNIMTDSPFGLGTVSITGHCRLDGADTRAANGFATIGNSFAISNGPTVNFGTGSKIALKTGVLNIDAASGNPTFSTALHADFAIGRTSEIFQVGNTPAGFTKSGPGTMSIFGNAPTLRGPVTLRNGNLHVEGTIAAQNAALASFTLARAPGQPAPILSGTGRIFAVTTNAGPRTIVRPGRAATQRALALEPGILTFGGGHFQMEASSQLDILIDGDLAGNGPGHHSQLAVNGPAAIDGAYLNITLASLPALHLPLIVLDNGGGSPIAGHFSDMITQAPLGESGHFFTPYQGAMQEFAISYFAGDGNDVAITRVPAPSGLGVLALVGLAAVRRRRPSHAST